MKYVNIFLLGFILFLSPFLEAQTPIRTAVHIIRDANGAGMSEQTARAAIDTLNKYYAQAFVDMRFYIDQMLILNTSSTTFDYEEVDCSSISVINLVEPTVQNALNIYFFPSIKAGAKGVAFRVPGRACVISYAYALSSTTAHEVGHCFGLYHTNEIEFGLENIVRTSTQTCPANWDLAGDKVGDTPAQASSGGSDADNCGSTYPSNPNHGNMMDTQTGDGERTYFTYGQKQRMQYYLQNYLNDLIFWVNVIVSNKIAGDNQTGTFLHIDGQYVPSGLGINLLYGRTHTGKTDSEILNSNYKHHDWDEINSQFKLTEPFNIRLDKPFRDANFVQIHPATVKNVLTEVSNSDLGRKDIKDPWWVDQNGTQPNDFRDLSPSSNINIFLIQNPDPNDATKPYYSVKALQTQIIPINGINTTFYFQNWSANTATSASLQNANALETGVVFKEANATVSANYKGTQLSNTSIAFANNSQRKIVTTVNYGYNFMTYESLGKVWLEMSDDNGLNWSIVNNGLPLGGYDAKSPSLAVIDGVENMIFVVYQQKTSNGKYQIILDKYNYEGLLVYSSVVYVSDNDYATKNAVPVIAASVDAANSNTKKFISVWKENSTATTTGGLYYRGGIDWTSCIEWKSPNAERITYSNNYATTPSIAVDRYINYNNNFNFHLVWEESAAIKYIPFSFSLSGVTLQSASLAVISTGSGYDSRKPSITVINNIPHVTWLSDYIVDDAAVFYRGKPGTSWGSIYTYLEQDGVNNISINNTENNDFAFAWSAMGGYYNKVVKSTAMGSCSVLGTHVQDMQLGNSTNDDMMLITYTNTSLPYSFGKTNIPFNYYNLSKATNNLFTQGRGISVIKGENTIHYAVSSVSANGGQVEFENKNDSLLTGSLLTVPFPVNDNSTLEYAVRFKTNDSLKAAKSLNNSEGLLFKVELLDANTNVVLAVLDNLTITKQTVKKNETINYSVALAGIGERSVRIRLTASDSEPEVKTVVSRIFESSTEGLGKKTIKQLNYSSIAQIKDYALTQNYPNPFNPVTTINYQLPKSGSVTLKVFDILGNEVKTLVNEQKEMGRYTVQFDASSLASGMYVYQLRVNDYTSTKKMMLVK
ncbi:MAG: zinc-dependent metalloprotease [Ignavibacteriaceae bacterium]|jgi:hypothetical protein